MKKALLVFAMLLGAVILLSQFALTVIAAGKAEYGWMMLAVVNSVSLVVLLAEGWGKIKH